MVDLSKLPLYLLESITGEDSTEEAIEQFKQKCLIPDRNILKHTYVAMPDGSLKHLDHLHAFKQLLKVDLKDKNPIAITENSPTNKD